MNWSKEGLSGLNGLKWVFTEHTGKGEEKCGKMKINGERLAGTTESSYASLESNI